MTDNLKEALKEVDNLDVCDDNRKIVKRILCKVVGEKYENENIENENIEMETCRFYETDKDEIIIKSGNDYTHIFINLKTGNITHTDDPNDEYCNKNYQFKKIPFGNIKEIKIIKE